MILAAFCVRCKDSLQIVMLWWKSLGRLKWCTTGLHPSLSFLAVSRNNPLLLSSTIFQSSLKSITWPLSLPWKQYPDINCVCPWWDAGDRLITVWKIRHVSSSYLYAQSNGGAEQVVQTAKNFMKKEDPAKALLAYHSIRLQGGSSPSESLFGHQIRSSLPCGTLRSLKPNWPSIESWNWEDSERNVKQKAPSW